MAKVYGLDKSLTAIYTMLAGINRVDSIWTGHRFLANIHDVNPSDSGSTGWFSGNISKFKVKCN